MKGRGHEVRTRSARSLLQPALHRGVEGDGRGCELGEPYEAERLRGATLPVHAAVFPLDRQRPAVSDLVERPKELLEAAVSAPGRDEVPAAGTVAERKVRAENRAAAIEPTLCVLDVHVLD